MIRIARLTGAALKDALDDLAQLRIEVFRVFPYLYDGDVGYERRYLQTYRDSENAILVGAFEATGWWGPRPAHRWRNTRMSSRLLLKDIPLSEIFYCAESVLLPEYRIPNTGGRGLVTPFSMPARPMPAILDAAIRRSAGWFAL